MKYQWSESGIRAREIVVNDGEKKQEEVPFQICSVSTGSINALTPTSFLFLTEHLRQMSLLQLVEDLHISRIYIEEGDSQLRLPSFANLRSLEI